MKRNLLFLIGLILILPCCVLLCACNKTPPEHKAQSSWQIDDSHHWHKCNQSNCVEVFDKQSHMWNTGVQTIVGDCDTQGVKTFTCIVCGYTKTENTGLGIEHSFSDDWSYSSEKHWKKAICSHTELVSLEQSHSFDANNICTVCGFEVYTQGLIFTPAINQQSQYIVSDVHR